MTVMEHPLMEAHMDVSELWIFKHGAHFNQCFNFSSSQSERLFVCVNFWSPSEHVHDR